MNPLISTLWICLFSQSVFSPLVHKDIVMLSKSCWNPNKLNKYSKCGHIQYGALPVYQSVISRTKGVSLHELLLFLFLQCSHSSVSLPSQLLIFVSVLYQVFDFILGTTLRSRFSCYFYFTSKEICLIEMNNLSLSLVISLRSRRAGLKSSLPFHQAWALLLILPPSSFFLLLLCQ